MNSLTERPTSRKLMILSNGRPGEARSILDWRVMMERRYSVCTIGLQRGVPKEKERKGEVNWSRFLDCQIDSSLGGFPGKRNGGGQTGVGHNHHHHHRLVSSLKEFKWERLPRISLSLTITSSLILPLTHTGYDCTSTGAANTTNHD